MSTENKLIPVILSGGSGTRLWPLSRETYPKQLLRLVGNYSLLQETVLRAQYISPSLPIILICNEAHRFLIAAQIQELGIANVHIILEPKGRNTAPAAAIAALLATRFDFNPSLLIMPADHIISQPEHFRERVMEALPFTKENNLVTFGVKPTKPETGYGYIKLGAEFKNHIFKVEKFIEKPTLEHAKQFIAAENYYWNSGIFMFNSESYLNALDTYEPLMLSLCREAFTHAHQESDFIRLNAEIFATCPANSIDYAVMEKTPNAIVATLKTGWNDLGSFASLYETSQADNNGNVVRGNVQIENVNNCYIHSNGRLITAVGVSDHVIVETNDAILVAHKDHSQNIKILVDKLKQAGHSEPFEHKKIHRPWGSYEIIAMADNFKVKHITVNPNCRLSLQMHHHRSEHWVIVKGTAKITRGDEELILSENQSTYIPPMTQHRLENPTGTPLELIEVQSGTYLGEDDIVRFHDDYGREKQCV